MYISVNPSFNILKGDLRGSKLYRHVFVMLYSNYLFQIIVNMVTKLITATRLMLEIATNRKRDQIAVRRASICRITQIQVNCLFFLYKKHTKVPYWITVYNSIPDTDLVQ